MTANRTLIGHKCAGVIRAYAELEGIALREAFDIFYKSNLYVEIRNGISDMHCRSDGYLAEELRIELSRASNMQNNTGMRPSQRSEGAYLPDAINNYWKAERSISCERIDRFTDK